MAQSRLVGLVGIEDTVVVETKDAVLVCKQNRSEEVKTLVQQLNASGAIESQLHQEVFRPWGKYNCIDQGERYQVKKLTVGAKTKSAEEDSCGARTAKVVRGSDEFLLKENQSRYTPW